MSFYTIHDALDKRLKLVPNLPTLQEENTQINLGSGTKSWSRSTFIPNPTMRTSLGLNGLDELNGIYQIDLFYPINSGYAIVEQMSEQVQTYFQVGDIINGIRVINCYPVNSYQIITNYYSIPIIVEWSYFKSRPTPVII